MPGMPISSSTRSGFTRLAASSARRVVAGAAGWHFFAHLPRQPHDELAALARPVAMRLHFPAMHLDQAFSQRQSNAEAGLGAPVQLRRLRKEIEHRRQRRRLNADAVVLYAYLDELTNRARRQ